MNTAHQHWSKWVSWSIAAASILVSVLAPIVVVAGWSDADIGDSLVTVVGTVLFLLVGPVYGVVGAAIVSNQKGNSIGWVMMFVSLGMTATVLVEILVPVSKPDQVSVVAAILLVLGGLAWVFFIFPVFHLMLTFPTGRALSPAWRPFLLLELLALAFILFTGLFGETVSAPDGRWTVDNPLGFIPEIWDSGPAGPMFQASLLALLVAGLVSMALRFRRASAIERQQLKSLVFAVAFFAFVFGALALISGGEDSQLVEVLLPLSITGIGLAVGVAVLRYGLYDIDRIISRTVAYGLVAVTLTVAYLAVVLGVGAFVTTVGPSDVGAVNLPVVATALVALAFQPVRQRALRVANGLVFGRRRTPYEALAGVGGGRLDELLPQVARLAMESTAARRAIVWLSHGVELRAAAIFPDDGSLPDPVPLDDGHLLVVLDQAHTVPMTHQDDLLGAITVVMGLGENLPADDRRLLNDLAAHAAVTLRGVLDTTPLPAGIVTFLMTDIEGSTRLWEDDPEAMAAALRDHDSMVRQVVAGGGGVLVKWRGEGDSTFSVFTNAAEAVATAAALQDSISRHPWLTSWPVSIRAALHTGEAELRDRDYFGQTVNRCARLRLLARGGQTLVSAATRELARQGLPETVTFKDLGEHQLKDMSEPERVYEVVAKALAVSDALAHSDGQ
jgi:class 3 adenylate cyclase